MAKNKQAVVLIHGVGEQIPMNTLRGFVKAAWTTHTDIQEDSRGEQSWSKPDYISEDYELRRITTTSNKAGKRTDFFEFYWAHMMEDTKLDHVWAWVSVLMLRRPARVPRQLLGIWSGLWVSSLVTAAFVVAYNCNVFNDMPVTRRILGTVFPALWIGIAWALRRIGGDAARYLHVAPSNILSRKNIRDAGIRLVERLHQSGDYDRIIVVGHSLGSVVGYDILTHLWTNTTTPTFAPGREIRALNSRNCRRSRTRKRSTSTATNNSNQNTLPNFGHKVTAG